MKSNENILNLLVHCLNRRPANAVESEFKTLSAADWENLIKDANRHGVTALLYFSLKSKSLLDFVPPKIVRRLHHASLWTAERNIRIYRQLFQVISMFNRYEIPLILLKGAYLIEGVYHNIAMRSMADIDIMARREDLQKGEKILNQLGYSAMRPYIPEIDSVRHQHILPFTKENAVPMELHWNIFDPETPFQLDPEDLWDRARPFSIEGQPTRVLSLEDQVLHLSIHSGYHHGFDMGLIHLCDIDQIISRFSGELDWVSVVERAKAWGFERCLYVTFKMVSELLGTNIPEETIESCQADNFSANIHELANAQLFGEKGEIAIADTFPELLEIEGFFTKMRFLLTRVFPTRKEMVRFYPIKCIFPNALFILLCAYPRYCQEIR